MTELTEIGPRARKELHKLLDEAIEHVSSKVPYRGEAHGRLQPVSLEGSYGEGLVSLDGVTVDVDIHLLLTAKQNGRPLK